MNIKDYYSILELPPTASPDDVKRAYRRLAQVYHPDKSGDDPYARAQFNAIKEAYETLTHPQKKEDYLQERWYAKSQGSMATVAPVTPVSFLKRLIQKEREVYQRDAYRSDFRALSQELEEFYSDETIETLRSFGDDQNLQEIVRYSLRMAGKIPYPHVDGLLKRVARLDIHRKYEAEIERLRKKSKSSYLVEKNMPWLMALIVLLICLLIATA